ncbi:MAG: hypothetical protein V4489_05305 [Chlamydiota bacterium]
MAVDKTGYNLGSIMVWLHGLTHGGHTKSQEGHGKGISALNTTLKDISQLTTLLTKELPSGQAVLQQYHNLIDRIKHATKDLITVGDTCVWNTAEEIKSQLKLLQEKCQHITQEINLVYTKLGQGEKDMSEITQMFFSMVKQNTELLKQLQPR